MARTFFVGGNWKCNGTKDSIATLCSTWKESGAGVAGGPVEVVIAPPSVYAVSAAASLPDGYQVSLQNTWTGKGGAFTGELSAEMAKDCVRWWVLSPCSLFWCALLEHGEATRYWIIGVLGWLLVGPAGGTFYADCGTAR